MQHSLKLGGTNYHFTWVKVPGTAPYRKAWWNEDYNTTNSYFSFSL